MMGLQKVLFKKNFVYKLLLPAEIAYIECWMSFGISLLNSDTFGTKFLCMPKMSGWMCGSVVRMFR